MKPNEEERLRESVLTDVTVQLLSWPDCAICKAKPAILEAVHKRNKSARVACCGETACKTQAAAEARRRAALEAEFALAQKQRATQ